MSGYLSGFPEATTPQLDEYYHHYNGSSPSATPPHAGCAPGGCEFPPYADPPHDPYADPDAGREPGWLARDNEPDTGAWSTGLDGINQAGQEPEAGG